MIGETLIIAGAIGLAALILEPPLMRIATALQDLANAVHSISKRGLGGAQE